MRGVTLLASGLKSRRCDGGCGKVRVHCCNMEGGSSGGRKRGNKKKSEKGRKNVVRKFVSLVR